MIKKIIRKISSFIKSPKEGFNQLINPRMMANQMFDLFGVKKRFAYLEDVVLYVNSVCNLKCIMCDVGQRNARGIDRLRMTQKNINLDLDLLKKLLDDSYIKKTKPLFTIVMTEPLLHPDICKIIKLIKEKGHKVDLTTNGYLLPKKANGLIFNGINKIQISIDGTAKIHDKIRGVEGAYANAIKGIKILNKDRDIKIVINYTVFCLNDSEILNFLEKINNEGIKIDLVKFQFMVFVSKEMKEMHNKSCDVKQTESCITEVVHPNKINIKELSKQLCSIKKNYKNIKKISIIPCISDEESLSKYFDVKGEKINGNSKCYAPYNQFAFTTDGKILIHSRCFNYIYGDFNKEPIKKIFYNKRIKEFRKKLEKANFCFPACTRCCGVMAYGQCPK